MEEAAVVAGRTGRLGPERVLASCLFEIVKRPLVDVPAQQAQLALPLAVGMGSKKSLALGQGLLVPADPWKEIELRSVIGAGRLVRRDSQPFQRTGETKRKALPG